MNESYPEHQQTATGSRSLRGRRDLQLLLRRKGQWVEAGRLARITLQYRMHLKEYRDKGYVIESRTARLNGRSRLWFRLTRSPGDPVLAGGER
jgi:hypothetical protein